jgi:hypothetical protein
MLGFMFRWFVFTLLICHSCFGSLSLKENFKKAEKGDYIVTAQCGSYTLLAIHDKDGANATIDEITIPQEKLPALSWQEWIKQGACGATSWIRFTLDLNTGQIIASSHGMGGQQIYLSTLLNLKLEKVPDVDRKRIGARPQPKLADRRPFWTPPLIFEGKKEEGVSFDAWRTLWPHDGTELSGQLIVAYLPPPSSPYPSYFPYWLEVGGVLGKAKIRIVDTGKGLITEKR